MQFLLIPFLASTAIASPDCGTRLPGKGRILGGTNVTVAGKWPWMIYLERRIDTESTGPRLSQCGGTILNKRWILTAGHCVRYFDGGEYRTGDGGDFLVLGEVTNASSTAILNSLLNKHTYRGRNVHLHPLYSETYTVNQMTPANDIALLELDQPISFDSSVAPICLPHIDQDVPVDGQAVATGFGFANNRKTDELADDEQLRETIVPIVREDICETRWFNHQSYPLEQWRKYRIICAGAMGHDTRQGDSGGPLMMKADDGRWFQIGITSFGEDDTNQADAVPGVYTDVREYCEWISETTKGEVKCQEETVTLQDVGIKV